MKAQLTELLTNYGEIAGIWFDGNWDQINKEGSFYSGQEIDWHYEEIYKLIHSIQPQCLIGNNHHQAIKAGEDFQMFERDLPGQNTKGWGTVNKHIGELPKEVCSTINESWGFKLKDNQNKTSKELIRYLVKSAGHDSNLLLNVGPMPNGKIQDEHIALLKEVGQWLKGNGETIYGTRGGSIKPTDKIAFTQKGKTIYMHVFDINGEALFIPDFDAKIKSVKLYNSKEHLKHKKSEYGLFIKLPKEKINQIDTIIEIDIK